MFVLPELPYPYGSLEPVLSDELMHVHHDKHHATYVNNLNKMLADEGASPASMEDVVREAAAKDQKKKFNNAGQAWNHAFFWECMAPAPAKPAGALAAAIEAFGGLDTLKTKFVEEGVGHFASGWVWIMAKDGALTVMSTHDAGCPVASDPASTAVLVCDLWEHAYYLVHKQDRKGFLEKWFDSLANWEFAGKQFAASQGQGQGYKYPAPTAG